MTASDPHRAFNGMQAMGGWIDRIRAALTRIVSRPTFRAWAARFPLTAPIARRRARQLFDVCAGFVYSQVLLTCVRLRVFEILAEGPLTLGELSRRLALPQEATARLADAAVALRLLRGARGDRYALGPLGAALVGNDAVRSMIEHNALLYVDLLDPVALLRSGGGAGELARYWPYAAVHDRLEPATAAVATYSDLMSLSQPLVAQEILDAYPLRRHRCLLDVGGGNGEFVGAVAARVPGLRLQLFDLPPVVELAKRRLANLIQQARVETFGGSFFHDELPTGADVVSLVRVLHDHDDNSVRQILAAVRRILPPHGVVLVAEPMAGTSGAETTEAYFDFYLFAMGKGRPRSAAELSRMLLDAGFVSPRRLTTHVPLQTGLLMARVR